jgi:hypothetical protein
MVSLLLGWLTVYYIDFATEEGGRIGCSDDSTRRPPTVISTGSLGKRANQASNFSSINLLTRLGLTDLFSTILGMCAHTLSIVSVVSEMAVTEYRIVITNKHSQTCGATASIEVICRFQYH